MTPSDHSSDDDDAMWKLAMRNVKKLDPTLKENDRIPFKNPEKPRNNSALSGSAPVYTPVSLGPGLDRRTEQRFQQGKMQIEARLDLHGMTLAEAEPAVRDFIRRQYAAGKRCVLIITGKGTGKIEKNKDEDLWFESRPGGIRRNFFHWLDNPDLKPLVLSVSPARAAHGGSGAFYVLLRRQR